MKYKSPNDDYDFTQDWSSEILTDTISTSTWTVETGITKGVESNAANTTTLWVSGGEAGKVYKVTNQITTAAGRTHEQEWYLTVQDQLTA